MERKAQYLCNDVAVFRMDLGDGTNVPDHAQDFIYLRQRKAGSESGSLPMAVLPAPSAEGPLLPSTGEHGQGHGVGPRGSGSTTGSLKRLSAFLGHTVPS